jgi:copper chaperone
MEYIFEVENIKCSGCIKSIRSGLLGVEGVSDVQVQLESGRVVVQGKLDLQNKLRSKLEQMGYPLVGENNFSKKAQSFISCVTGRVFCD